MSGYLEGVTLWRTTKEEEGEGHRSSRRGDIIALSRLTPRTKRVSRWGKPRQMEVLYQCLSSLITNSNSNSS